MIRMTRTSHLALAAVLLASPFALAQKDPGVALNNIDHSVKPGDDFYSYANGAWMKRTEIPADRTAVGGFAIAADRTDLRVKEIVQNPANSKAAPGTDSRKIADLYASYMDTATLEKLGTAPMKPYLTAIDAIHNGNELSAALGKTLRADTDALNNTNFHTSNLFGLWVAPSFNDPDHYTAYLMQGGIELPDRAYYLGESTHMKEIQAKYKEHVARLFTLAGFDHADERAARVYDLELAIAKVHLALADNEDIHKANNPWKSTDFPTKAPGLNWSAYFTAAGLSHQKDFIVWQPSAITAESALVGSQPLDAWKDYLRLHLIEKFGGALPKAFQDEAFAFYGKTLRGAPQQRPRDQRAVAYVSGILGDAVGKIYAEKYFNAEQKARVQALVANIIAAFHTRLEENTWMAPATRKEAIAKLDTLQVGVGYADHWQSYAAREIKPDDLAGNVLRTSLFNYHYELSRIGKPTDRKEWTMTPQTVNAVNLPLDNGLNFPAAILQPPFYDPAAPDAYNYGAIGSVIGHEISHTFDSEGAAFDSRGRVRNWWTESDLKHFEASTTALAAQYDKYEPFPGVHVNGRQTLGENIADVAGLTASYDAFHISLHGKPAPVVDSLSGDQQFFLAFAQNWASKSREAAARAQVVTDPHSPSEYRADTVRNLDGWYPAFDVKPGEKLYLAPEDRVHIW
jgi:endothelin-converting enzyme/putative endopeptidase